MSQSATDWKNHRKPETNYERNAEINNIDKQSKQCRGLRLDAEARGRANWKRGARVKDAKALTLTQRKAAWGIPVYPAQAKSSQRRQSEHIHTDLEHTCKNTVTREPNDHLRYKLPAKCRH